MKPEMKMVDWKAKYFSKMLSEDYMIKFVEPKYTIGEKCRMGFWMWLKEFLDIAIPALVLSALLTIFFRIAF